jgi:DNA-binding response OmpR family regulator
VRSVITRILRSEGYLVFEMATAHEALQEAVDFDLVIADVSLPGCCSGIQAAVELSNTRPGLKVLLISGVPTDCWSEADRKEFVKLPAGSFVAKPFSSRVLVNTVERLLAA